MAVDAISDQGKKVEESIRLKGTSKDRQANNGWKVKFSILEKAGADKKTIYETMGSQEYKSLTLKEKYTTQFNLLAFLFGPLYYFHKKMWSKGVALLGFVGLVGVLLLFIEAVIQIILPAALFWVVPAIFMAHIANYDYYRHVEHGERTWINMPHFLSKPMSAALVPIVALLLAMSMATLTPRFSQAMDTLKLEKVSGVWVADSDGTRISIDFSGNQKVFKIAASTIPVSVRDIDNHNDTIILSVSLNDNREVLWTLHQAIGENNQMKLLLTIHDGTEENLSFIRNL